MAPWRHVAEVQIMMGIGSEIPAPWMGHLFITKYFGESSDARLPLFAPEKKTENEGVDSIYLTKS